MRKLVFLAILTFCALPARAETAIAHGHIDAGGRWTRLYSISVVADGNGPDGFFFDVTPYRGRKIHAVTVRNGGCLTGLPCVPVDLDLNFHDTTTPGFPHWAYVGGCSTAASNETCPVPSTATRGEVSGYSGIDVDVDVYVLGD